MPRKQVIVVQQTMPLPQVWPEPAQFMFEQAPFTQKPPQHWPPDVHVAPFWRQACCAHVLLVQAPLQQSAVLTQAPPLGLQAQRLPPHEPLQQLPPPPVQGAPTLMQSQRPLVQEPLQQSPGTVQGTSRALHALLHTPFVHAAPLQQSLEFVHGPFSGLQAQLPATQLPPQQSPLPTQPAPTGPQLAEQNPFTQRGAAAQQRAPVEHACPAFAHESAQAPFTHVEPGGQVPQEWPQPSSPHTLPAQLPLQTVAQTPPMQLPEQQSWSPPQPLPIGPHADEHIPATQKPPQQALPCAHAS